MGVGGNKHLAAAHAGEEGEGLVGGWGGEERAAPPHILLPLDHARERGGKDAALPATLPPNAPPHTQKFLWYNASAGNAPNDGSGGSSWGQASTTYIFRPNVSAPLPVMG